jgi:hypothetical protein
LGRHAGAIGNQQGQATIDWMALVLLVALVAGASVKLAPSFDGKSLGGALAHGLLCAVKRSCTTDDGDAALAEAYGSRNAHLVRRQLPSLVFEPGERQLPVDWRECREVACATTADDHAVDAHRTDAGRRVTVFTRLIQEAGTRYIQYWAYYPDSNTTLAGSDKLWERSVIAQLAGKLLTGSTRYPGYHRDDWEAASVRIGRNGSATLRVTSHGHWQWCKYRGCRGRWGRHTGWMRVSKGSHAGHVPLERIGELRERTSTARGIRLVPLESIDSRGYRRLDPDIAPPWSKDAYANPESSDS